MLTKIVSLLLLLLLFLTAACGATRAESVQSDSADQEPMVAASGPGWILPRQGATGLTIQTVNVPRVHIRVLRVSERRMTNGTLDGEEEHYWRQRLRPDPQKQSFTLYELRNLTDADLTEVWSGTMQTGPGRNKTIETAFPLAGLVDTAKPGAYLVLVEDAGQASVRLVRKPGEQIDWQYEENTHIAGHWVLSSDLGLSTLQGQDGLHVSVRSLGTAMPLAGVRLQLLSRAQDVLGEATTDANGQATFAPGLLRGKLGAAAAMLLARAGNSDFVSQNLTTPAFDLSDRGAEGRPVPGPIEAYVYTDRGIYRPGETVQTMALLRTHGLTAIDDSGLTLILRRPDGVEARRLTLPPQPDAGFQQAIPLAASAAQGDWTIEALVDPTLPPIGRATIAVQDFVPQQLKVSLTGPTTPIEAGAHLTAALDGRFLYGAPGAGLHAEGDIKLVRDEHPVPDATGYVFGLIDETIPDSVQKLELPDADEKGHVVIDAALTFPDNVASPLRAVLDAGLTEPGGRAVRDSLKIPVRTHPLLIGVRKAFADRVDIGAAATFEIRAFDASGTPTPHSGLTWRLVREDRHYQWWRESGRSGWTWHYEVVDEEVAKGALNVPSDRPVTLTRTMDWGTYRLVVSDADSGASTSLRFTAGWGWNVSDAAADVPDRLDVATDRAVVPSGGTTHVHLRGPFAGHAQVVVESAGQVLESRQLDLPRDGATFDLTSTAAWGPGVHVVATAYRPLTAPSRPHDPVRAVGLAWIAADPAPHTLSVSIGGVQQTTPRHAIMVPIHVTGGHGRAFVTLAAVDEGILQLTHFASPDPVAVLLGRTRLGLDLRDDYGKLLEGHAEVGAIRQGGDEGSLGGAGLPVTTTRTVALFHGPVAVDANGDAQIPLDLPDFAGELRLMAVAYDHDAVGHAEAALTVRDPVVADVSLPRFLAPGDLAGINVSLNNTDGPAGDYHLTLTPSGAVGLRGPATLDLTLAAGERRAGQMTLVGAQAGIGHLQAVLTGPVGLHIEHERDITIRSPHPDLVVSRTDSQAPGETYTPDPGLFAVFVPGSVRLTVGYSVLGRIDVPGLLQSLYTYPYGCTEQLSSSAFPLLYFNSAAFLGSTQDAAGVHKRVQDAIDTIAGRQDSDGEFGLWHVRDHGASTWLNVYALDFLQHAREGGFAVPDAVTSGSAHWIEQRLLSLTDYDYSGAYAEPPQPTRAYAAYVLARSNRVDPSVLRTLRGNLMWNSTNGSAMPGTVAWRQVGVAFPLSLAQLAGAESLMGDAREAATTFRLAIGNLDTASPPHWWYGAYYWSELRDRAGMLAIAAETGNMDVAARMIDRIDRELPNPQQMNTQEKAWLLAAAHALQKQGRTAALSIDDGPSQAVTLPYAVPVPADAIGRIRIRNTDKAPVFRTITLRGAPAEAPPAMAAGFDIRRETFTLDGKRLDTAHLRQTDRFIVVLTGRVSDHAFRRAVVADPLPAGLEIEAPILKEDAYPFLGELTHVRAHEERDDRFVAAFDVGPDRGDGYHGFREKEDKPGALDEDEFRVAYIARAVTPGNFVQPETVIEDMYHPEVMARTTASEMEVAPR